jgi:tetratricopeptide (TPR) repeat protein
MDPKDITVRPDETRERMGKAMASFKAGRYPESTAVTEEILAMDPANRAARDLSNASHYQWGKSLYQGKKYSEALDRFSRVDAGYRDVAELIGASKKQLAEVHYLNGIKFFTQEKLDQAIEEWDETLKLNPQHPKAKMDRDQAVKLLQRLKEIK